MVVGFHKNMKLFMMALIFAAFYLFYWKLSPIMPYDTDDWYYMGYFRYPFPMWGDWNPTRILPEIMMPNVSILAAIVIFPVTGDYIESMVIMYAAIMAVILTILCVELHKLFSSITPCKIVSAGLTGLWICLHFTLLVNAYSDNTWLWSSITAACYFYYTIPAILNEIVVVYMLRKGNRISKRGWLFLAIMGYFGIFSNLFPAIILGAYAGIEFLFHISRIIVNKESNSIHINKNRINRNNTGLLTRVMKENSYNIYIIILFLISVYFEMYGGRASGFEGFDLIGTLKKLLDTVLGYNKIVICSCLIILFFAIYKYIKIRPSRNDYTNWIRILSMTFPVVLFLVLVCSKTGSWYIGRADVQLVILFFPLLAAFVFIANSLRDIEERPKQVCMLFLLAIVLNIIVLIPFNEKYYKPTNISLLEPEVCKKIDEDIVTQILDAKNQGALEMELHVPKFTTDDNWPMAIYSGGSVSRFPYTLWRHGLIDSGIYITVVPDKDKNIEFGIS